MKELKYKSNNNVILEFRKDSLWSRSPLSPIFFEKNISVSTTKYSNAVTYTKKADNLWVVQIDWAKVLMNSLEDTFTVYVMYSGNVKLKEEIKIKFPPVKLTPYVFDYKLSPEPTTAKWGTSGKLCTLKISLKSSYKAWMFKENLSTITFKLSNQCGFVPMVDGCSKTFPLEKGCSVNLKYQGYDKETPLKNNEHKNIVFEINLIEHSIPFLFTPRPYSYELTPSCSSHEYQYGSKNRELFRITVNRKDQFSPIASKIEISSIIPNNVFGKFFEVKKEKSEWIVLVNEKANYKTLSAGIEATIKFTIDEGKQYCEVNFGFGFNSNTTGLFFKLLPGEKPFLHVTPSPNLVRYVGQNGKNACALVVTNNCNAEISVRNIPLDKLLTIQGKVQKTISNAPHTYLIDIDTSRPTRKNVHFVVQTNETEEASVGYEVIIKERPEPIVSVEIDNIDESEDVQKIVVGESYEKDTCCAKCIIGYATGSPSDSSLIDLSKIDFGERFYLYVDDFKDKLIPMGQTREVKLLFKDDITVSLNDIKILNEQDSSNGEALQEGKAKKKSYVLPCNWEYNSQKCSVNISAIMPQLYKKEVVSYLKEGKAKFPGPKEERTIKIFEYKYNDLTEEDIKKCWAQNQKIVIHPPFSFDKDEMVLERVIVPGDIVTFYLHINEIRGIEKETNNIDDPIHLNLIGETQADNHPSLSIRQKMMDNKGNLKRLPPEIIVEPIKDHPKMKVYFRTDDAEIKLLKKKRKLVPVKILQQADDVEALCIGYVVVQNESEMPYKDWGVRGCINTIKLNVGCDNNLLHERTLGLLPKEFQILNGEPEICVPIYLDFQEWESYSLNTNPILRINFTGVEYTDDEYDEMSVEILSSPNKEISYEAIIEPNYQYKDNIYSLDLGTTGIVVAKEIGDEPECVILEDEDNAIENDPEILSSHTMIISTGDNSSIVLAPAEDTYYLKPQSGSTHYRLVPTKFMVGQGRIPYLLNFYDNANVSKQLHLFQLEGQSINVSLQKEEGANRKNAKKANEKTISDLIKSLYKEIFRRFNQEVDKVKKLVVTYPNTYTIDNLEGIRGILINELGLNKNGQICFVPESDAVAAFYFNQIIYSRNFMLDENGNSRNEENVIFYDMGAGTLDLSLVSFKKEGEAGIVASIINKIGIPLAGNYLDYLIFKTLLEEKWVNSKIEDKHNTIKEITKDIKINYENGESIATLRPSWFIENQDLFENKDEFGKKKYTDIFKDKIAAFITACSETALKCLIPKDMIVHTIVFSGRGSQFGILKSAVETSLKNMMGDNVKIKVDKLRKTSNCGDHLKTCVALGALKYQSFFSSDGNYKVRNKNLYSKIAVVYWGKIGENYDVNVKYIIDPLDPKNDWSKAEFVDGTLCMEFDAYEVISNMVPGMMYYVQTSLGEEDLKHLYRKVYEDDSDSSSKDDLNWAFVNLLFKKRVSSSSFSVKLKISKDCKIIEREIAGEILTDTKLLENVENNILYRRSMWPFITTL